MKDAQPQFDKCARCGRPVRSGRQGTITAWISAERECACALQSEASKKQSLEPAVLESDVARLRMPNQDGSPFASSEIANAFPSSEEQLEESEDEGYEDEDDEDDGNDEQNSAELAEKSSSRSSVIWKRTISVMSIALLGISCFVAGGTTAYFGVGPFMVRKSPAASNQLLEEPNDKEFLGIGSLAEKKEDSVGYAQSIQTAKRNYSTNLILASTVPPTDQQLHGLSSLTALQHLTLDCTNLSKDSLGQLPPNVTDLTLRNSSTLRSIQSLRELKVLKVENPTLTTSDYQAVAGTPNLKELNVSFAKISEDDARALQTSMLDFVAFQHVQMSGDAYRLLSQAQNLKSIFCDSLSTNLANLNDIFKGSASIQVTLGDVSSRKTHKTYTGPAWNFKTSDAKRMQQVELEKLPCLVLDPFYANGRLQCLKALTAVRNLDLSQMKLTRNDMADVPDNDVQRLVVKDVSDDVLSLITKFPNLRSLVIYGGEISENDGKELAKLKSLSELTLSKVQLKKNAISAINSVSMPRLAYLMLDNCGFDSSDKGEFGTLNKLTTLRVLSSFFNLASLEGNELRRLEINDVFILPADVGSLKKLSHLQEFVVNEGSFTPAVQRALEQHFSKSVLRIINPEF